MKLVSFRLGDEVRLGIKVETGIVDVKKEAAFLALEVPATMEELIAAGKEGLARLAELLKHDVATIPEADIVFAPCVTNPEKILCVGLNYLDHAEELKVPPPETPVLFSKFNNALAAHKQVIKLPETAENFDYEAELVIVIGRKARGVTKEEAPHYIFGYTVGNDLTARDLQFRTTQWLLGKTCDGFAPIGPYLVTADEVDPANLDIRCEVNGTLRQASNTSNLIFDCASIVSYVSQYMTLKPGDIIFTGTPGGVMSGYPPEKQEWLKPGDEVKVTIEKIGTLVNVMG